MKKNNVAGMALAVAAAAVGMAQAAQPTAGAPLDRAALLALADNYLGALVAHDKIRGDQIHEIEALGISVDYNSPTGWE